jgi:hypothetical protein
MALFHPEWIKIGTMSQTLGGLDTLLQQAVDLASNLDGLWSSVDQAADQVTRGADWLYTRLPK